MIDNIHNAMRFIALLRNGRMSDRYVIKLSVFWSYIVLVIMYNGVRNYHII